MKASKHASGLAIAALFVACGSSESDDAPTRTRCLSAGQSETCACTDGRMGKQVCKEDGTLGACVCGAASSASGGRSASSSGGSAGRASGGASLGGSAGADVRGGAGGEPEGG